MISTPQTKHYTKTDASADALKFAHRWLFKRVEINEEQWVTLMFEYGDRFAAIFSMMFEDKAEWLHNYLVTAPPDKGNTHNWFWMWFKMKWMQDDWEYIDQKIYCQPVTYMQYKTYLLNCEILEQDLLNLLLSKNITKPTLQSF